MLQATVIDRGVYLRRNVDEERPAQSDVEDLMSAANCEERFLLRERFLDRERFEQVAHGISSAHCLPEHWWDVRVIEFRLNIVAAGDHHAVATPDIFRDQLR